MTDRATMDDRVVPLTDEEKRQKLENLDRLSRMLDTQWRIPGLGIRFGADAVAGLIPGVGDAATGLISAYIVYHGMKIGAPKHVLGRMVGNVVIDTVVGSVPLLGSVFDVFYKSNTRNMRILRNHLERDLSKNR